MDSRALLLTAYEKYGTVGRDEFMHMYIDEELCIDESVIGEYNEYLSDSGYEEYFEMSMLDEILSGISPVEAIRLAYFGDFYFNDDYFTFNGYGNLESYTEYKLIKEISEDTEFLKKYIEDNDLIDWDEADEIIAEANELIRNGY